MGLGFGFMLQGVRMMQADWLVALVGAVGTLSLMRSKTVPAMFVLIAFGAVVGAVQQPELLDRLAAAPVGLIAPSFAIGTKVKVCLYQASFSKKRKIGIAHPETSGWAMHLRRSATLAA